MEKKSDGKMKSVTSIPANYVSIIQLQERWMREKEKKGDLEGERQVNGQGRREEDTMDVPRVKLKEKEQNCVKKEEVEKVSVIVSNEDENGDSSEKKKRLKKKKKKKNVKEMVKCESKVSAAHIPRKEKKKNDPVKEIVAKPSTAAEEIQFQNLWIKKRVEEEEGREVKGPVRMNNGRGYDRKNQRHDWSSTRVVGRTTTTRTMVWVKKDKNDGSACGNGV